MSGIKKSITELIGRTPLLQLVNYEKTNQLETEIIAKLEYFNPANSVKDRIAKSMIEDAEKKGLLNDGDIIVETTSGNTGIGVAAIAASKGYKLRVYIQDGVSEERTKIIKAYGAEIIKFSDVPEVAKILEEADGDFVVAIKTFKNEILKKEKDIVFLNQVENKANPGIHRDTTGPEIWEDTDGNVDIFVAAVGTGGTISGTGEYLKSKNSNVKIIAVEPGPLSVPSKDNPHPLEITGVHKFTEVEEDKIPANVNKEIFDEVIQIETLDAYETAREVAKTDGILVGISSGAALRAAAEVAKRPENKGKRIVVLLSDSGLSYLSTGLFQ